MNANILVVIEHLRGQVLEISHGLLKAARQLAEASGGRVIAVLAGQDIAALAGKLEADEVWTCEHAALAEFTPPAYLRVLQEIIPAEAPRAVLFGHTTIGMDLASVLSARLDLPLVSQCRHFEVQDGRPHFVSQLCGGKIFAEGELPEPCALVTMVAGGYPLEAGQGKPKIEARQVPDMDGLPVKLIEYIEPQSDDVDISREPVLISVGRGLQNQEDLEPVERLAAALNGTVSASRPLVDKGWLPTTRLVGKSGRRVRPRLYLALGISGAPEHVEAITGSEMIIAVNTDPEAPIFEVATYGVVMDMMDLIEAINQQMEQAQAA